MEIVTTQLDNTPSVSRGRLFATLFAILGVIGSAAAQTTTGGGTGAIDYSTAIGGFKDQMSASVTANLGALLGVAGIFLVLGLAWKFMKRAVKSA